MMIQSVQVETTSVSLSWTPEFPDHLHGPPSGYRLLLCKILASDSCKMFHTIETSATLSGLLPMTEYSLSVWAFNIDSFGDLLEEPRLSNVIKIETDAKFSMTIPIVLASFCLFITISLLIVAIKMNFFSIKPRYFQMRR